MLSSIKNSKLIEVIVTAIFLCIISPVIHSDIEVIQKLTSEGKFSEALNLTEQELQADSDNVTYRFLKGLILTRMDRLEQARDVFIEITKSNPDFPEPYNNLAVIYASMGDYDKARDLLEQAINTHPAYATAHENIGDIYAKLASQAYNQALELDKENNTAKAKLSLVNDLFSQSQNGKPVVLSSINDQNPKIVVGPVPVEEPDPTPSEKIILPAINKNSSKEIVINEITGNEQVPANLTNNQEIQVRVSRVKNAVLDWSVAWSRKDINTYLSHYASDFSPEDGRPMEQWRELRRNRLNAPAKIQILISDLVVEMLGLDHAQATFTQVYQSDVYNDRVKKTMLMKLENNNWRITQEHTK